MFFLCIVDVKSLLNIKTVKNEWLLPFVKNVRAETGYILSGFFIAC